MLFFNIFYFNSKDSFPIFNPFISLILVLVPLFQHAYTRVKQHGKESV